MKASDRLTKKRKIYIIWLLIMIFTAILTPNINNGKGWYLAVLVSFGIYQFIAYIYECYYYEQMCEKKNREAYIEEQNKVFDEYMANITKLRFDKVMKNTYKQLKYNNSPEFIFKEEYEDYKKIYKLYAVQLFTVLLFVWWMFVNWG